MKKKAIEKIPYLTLPKASRKKMVEYIGVTAFKVITHERHLFLEVYRNDKTCKDVPVVRIVLSKNDFGTFFPESGAWSRGRITMDTWDSYGLIWREDDERIRKSVDVIEKENILYSGEDLERIKAFTNINFWSERQWWKYVDRWQKNITAAENREKASRKYERRRQALEERKAQTQTLPEQKVLSYADDILFHNMHYLYYKKHGARAAMACSKCGGVSDSKWKRGESFEAHLEQIIEEPRAGMYGTCPMCKGRGKYMPQGRMKSFYRNKGHLFLGQKYKENGMVFRYIEVEKEWQLELICGEKGPEMHGAYEKLSGVELARVYFEPGKKIQKDYQKYDPYAGRDFWDDCNLSGMSNINIKEGKIMPETYENMEGTFLEYSAMKEYQRAAGVINPIDYLERYIHTPQIEMLVKMGLIQVVKKLVRCHYGIVADIDARRVDLFLGIRKERVKQLISRQGEGEILKVMQMEKRLGKNWTDEQVEQLAELKLDHDINTALEYMGIQKFLNHVSKYAGCPYGTMCSTASSRLQDTARTYIDYLNIRRDIGYDLENTVYLFPKNLRVAHNKMVMEQNKEEADERIREVNEKYQLIKKHYRRLRKKFYFEDEEFMIRPARDAGEIVMEGRILHHCVGGNNYLDKHNRDKSTILFLRFKAEPDIPYITVEIGTESLNILQWYGKGDKKPDKERMQKWLDAYVTRLKCEGAEAGMAGNEEMEQGLLAYA